MNTESVLKGLAGFGSDVLGDFIGSEMEQNNYQDNAKLSYQLGQMAQRNAIPNLVRGFKNAGLSPALASQGSFAPASQGSAPMQSRNIDPISLAQIELASASANKAQADADDKQIDVARKKFEDFTTAENLEIYFQRLAADRMKELGVESPEEAEKDDIYSYYSSMADLAPDANKGAMDGLRTFIQLVGENADLAPRLLAAELNRLVKSKQIDSEKVIDALVLDPHADYKVKLKQASNLIAQAYLANMHGKQIYHNDLAHMVENKDTQSALIYAGEKIFDDFASMGPLVLMRKLFGRRAPTTRRAMTTLERIPKPTDYNSSVFHSLK